MKLTKNLLSGRANFGALTLVVASLVAATVLLGPNASAQGGGGAGKVQMNDIWFGPASLEPIDPDLVQASESMEVGLLLPAVQILSEPASRVDVMAPGHSLTIDVFGGTVRTFAKMQIWLEEDTGRGFILNVRDPGGDVHVMPIEHKELVIRVRGAMQSDRVLVEAETASVRHNTLGNITTGENNEPVLIGMLLPAIQKVR